MGGWSCGNALHCWQFQYSSLLWRLEALECMCSVYVPAKCNQHIVIQKCILRTCKRYSYLQQCRAAAAAAACSTAAFALNGPAEENKTKPCRNGDIVAAASSGSSKKIWQRLHFDFPSRILPSNAFIIYQPASNRQQTVNSKQRAATATATQFRRLMLQLSTTATEALLPPLSHCSSFRAAACCIPLGVDSETTAATRDADANCGAR